MPNTPDRQPHQSTKAAEYNFDPRELYRRALELDPKNTGAVDIIKKLETPSAAR